MKFKPNQKVLIYDYENSNKLIAEGTFLEADKGIGDEDHCVRIDKAHDELYEMAIGVTIAFNPDHLEIDRRNLNLI